MKVAMLTTWFPPVIVGSGIRLYEIGKRLAEKYEIHVYTTGMDGCASEEVLDGMYVHRYGKVSTINSMESGAAILNTKFSADVLKKIRKDVDLIDCNIVSKTLPYISYYLSRRYRIPIVETWHEVWHIHNFKRHNFLLALPGFLLEYYMPRCAHMNIANSETTKRRLIKLLGVADEKIAVVPNGVNLDAFDIEIEKKFGRIIYVGRLETHKKVDELLFAYNRLKRKYNDIELIIIGKGPMKSYLNDLSRQLKLKDVFFYNPMPYRKLVELIKSSWMLVLPSIMEGQGIVLLEGMAAGTPTIAVQMKDSAVGDVIDNGFNGLLVRKPNQVKGAMKRLLEDKNLYNKIRANGLNFVKQYEWDKIAEKISEIYDVMCRRGC